jgi:hypothetical protein
MYKLITLNLSLLFFIIHLNFKNFDISNFKVITTSNHILCQSLITFIRIRIITKTVISFIRIITYLYISISKTWSNIFVTIYSILDIMTTHFHSIIYCKEKCIIVFFPSIGLIPLLFCESPKIFSIYSFYNNNSRSLIIALFMKILRFESMIYCWVN